MPLTLRPRAGIRVQPLLHPTGGGRVRVRERAGANGLTRCVSSGLVGERLPQQPHGRAGAVPGGGHDEPGTRGPGVVRPLQTQVPPRPAPPTRPTASPTASAQVADRHLGCRRRPRMAAPAWEGRLRQEFASARSHLGRGQGGSRVPLAPPGQGARSPQHPGRARGGGAGSDLGGEVDPRLRRL